ncbi:unnamed protein product [Pleuronectes platessa]|uniref:Uncharacterized protein n=1 Tax=Pleuronectes platessa TaxID=8262 RepID=A0A9N7UNK3_PLEPL|nr:unnamed protein product [Pleuronectes platessa]
MWPQLQPWICRRLGKGTQGKGSNQGCPNYGPQANCGPQYSLTEYKNKDISANVGLQVDEGKAITVLRAAEAHGTIIRPLNQSMAQVENVRSPRLHLTPCYYVLDCLSGHLCTACTTLSCLLW